MIIPLYQIQFIGLDVFELTHVLNQEPLGAAFSALTISPAEGVVETSMHGKSVSLETTAKLHRV